MKKHLLAWILVSLSLNATAMEESSSLAPIRLTIRRNESLYTALIKYYALQLPTKVVCQSLNNEEINLPAFEDKVYLPQDIIQDIISIQTPLQIIDLWRHINDTYPKQEKGKDLLEAIRKTWNHPRSINMDLLRHAGFTIDQIMEGPFVNLEIESLHPSIIGKVIPLIAQNTTLASLEINPQNKNNLTMDELQALGESLKKNKTLTSIGLDLKNIPNTPDFSFNDVFSSHTNFRRITLKYGVISDPVLHKIIDNIAFNTHLTHLDMSQTSISDGALVYLLEELSKIKSLEYLDVSYKYHHKFHDKALSVNAMEKIGSLLEIHPTLQWLDISRYKLVNGGIKYITKGMLASRSLKTLKLVGCDLYDDDLKDLCDALILNPSLTSLFIGFNNITHASVDFIARVFKTNTHLASFDLSDPAGCASLFHINNRGTNGAHKLLDSLKDNTTLTSLNLGKVDGEMCISSLTNLLKENQNLTAISLSHCTFQREEANQLGDVLKDHPTLKSLSLKNLRHRDREANIGYHIIEPITQSLWHNITITELSFGKSSIGNDGAASIARLLSYNQSITSLDISGFYSAENSVTTEGFKPLALALKNNKSLKKLDLSRQKLCSESLPLLADLFINNSTLEVLNLHKNKFQNFKKYRNVFAEGLLQNKALLQVNLSQCNLVEQNEHKFLQGFPGRIIF